MAKLEGFKREYLHVGGDIDDPQNEYWPPAPGIIYLDHSCDRWIIGNADNARVMILALQDAIDKSLALTDEKVGGTD